MDKEEAVKLVVKGAKHEREEQAIHQQRLHNKSLEQDIQERKNFADRAYGITQAWIGFLIVLTLSQFLLKKLGYGLTEVEFNIVFTTTTGSVLVFWHLVGKYLFNTKK